MICRPRRAIHRGIRRAPGKRLKGTQNLLCAYLAGAVLIGSVGNGLWGWWWLDPVARVLVAAVAIKEGKGGMVRW